MNAAQNLNSHRDDAHREAELAELKARKLSTTDPEAAAAALAEATDASLKAKVAEMAIDENERLNAEEVERQKQAAQAEALRELTKLRGEQHAAAVFFTDAVQELEECFNEIEALHMRAAALTRKVSADESVPVITTRIAALHKAIWHGAPTLAKRLRMAGIPGGMSRAAPLTDMYPKE